MRRGPAVDYDFADMARLLSEAERRRRRGNIEPAELNRDRMGIVERMIRSTVRVLDIAPDNTEWVNLNRLVELSNVRVRVHEVADVRRQIVADRGRNIDRTIGQTWNEGNIDVLLSSFKQWEDELQGANHEGPGCFILPPNVRHRLDIFLMITLANLIYQECVARGLTRDFTLNAYFRTSNRRPWNILKRNVHIRTVVVGGVRTFFVSYSDFMSLIAKFRSVINNAFERDDLIPTDEYDESGWTLVFNRVGENMKVWIDLMPGLAVRPGARWYPSYKPIIEAVFPRGGIKTVCNESDSLCLIYCLVLGAVRCIPNHENFMIRDKYIDVDRLASWVDRDSGIPSRLKDILRIDVRERSSMLVHALEAAESATALCLSEFVKWFQQIEKELFKDMDIGIDVFMMYMTSSAKVIPCYASQKQCSRRINLLIMQFKEGSHFALITDTTSVFRLTGGKMFDTCSRCNRTFFTRAAFNRHIVNGVCHADDELTYNWSTNYDMPDLVSGFPGYDGPEAGFCEKCHLRFSSDFLYEHHKKYCFMRRRSGTRYVKLLPADQTRLVSEEYDEGSALPNKHIMFADFECYIKDDGEHEFMSYGLFDGTKYKRGWDLKSFFERLVGYLKGNMCKEIYVYFHNAMNYDANFMLKYVLRHLPKWSVNVLMKSSSRLQSLKFTFNIAEKGERQRLVNIVIGDSFHFLTMSLERIVGSIRTDNEEENMSNFPLFFKEFSRKYTGANMGLISSILKKNIYPYYFFSCKERLETPYDDFSILFSPEYLQFFSEGTTAEEVTGARLDLEIMHRRMGVNSAKDYHDVYLRCDVMQLADVFTKTRETLFRSHHIDITDYVGMPAASWHAFLRHEVTLDIPLYTNTLYAEFFQSMTRGGVTSAAIRYARSTPTQSIIYFDVNGLYPFVMQEYKYPCGHFEWRSVEELPNGYTSWNSWFNNYVYPRLEISGNGCCLRVDMHLPAQFHEKFDKFPMAPEHVVLKSCFFKDNGEMYSFLKRWSDANDGEVMKPFIGLVGTLYPKREYGVHWKLLKWYIDHGMIIDRIHCLVLFREGDYLASYVRKNIEIRNTRNDELGKMVYKLMGNSIYGKTFESPFNHGHFDIIRNAEKLQGVLETQQVSMILPIDEDNTIVKYDAQEVVLDKPTYIGACVTEYAKLHMYKLLYDLLPVVYPDGVEMIYTDTDSFIIRVTHPEGVTGEQLIQRAVDAGLVGSKGGLIKSETGTDLIQEVIALRSKLYAYKTISGKIGKRAKGTTHAAQEMELTWEAYKNALTQLCSVTTTNVIFERCAFSVRTNRVTRQSISVNDGKRYICENGIDTHAWGFKGLKCDDLEADLESERGGER